MRFVILMSSDDEAWAALSSAEQSRVMAAHEACERELRAGKHFLASWRLRPADEARSVVREPDGSYCAKSSAELCAQLGGAYLIEVASRDDAEAWARRLRFIPGVNEVREVWE
ncbi:MAG: hypothetical protein FJ091_17480 [Deltaproteobacteria bacterium]|nr:hypothetical protein [Deltaproteobacteria bacterium]